MSLRDEFLRLLKEDEVFRYAVMGLLGVADLRSDLKRLADALDKVLGIVGQLADGQRQTLEVVKGLAEGQARLMDAVRQLADNQVKLMEGQSRLMDVVKELAEGQRELMNMTRQVLETVQRLADVETKHLEITQRILEEIKALREGQEELRVGLSNLRRDVGGLSRSVGMLIERDVRHYLPAWVRDALGIGIDRLRRRVVEGVGEFDGYAEAGNKVVVAEVKETLRLRDVEGFLEKVNKLRQAVAGREVIAILAFVKKGKDFDKAVELAKANGIRVIKHYGEEDFEEIT